MTLSEILDHILSTLRADPFLAGLEIIGNVEPDHNRRLETALRETGLALVVVLLIGKAAWDIVQQTGRVLVDTAPYSPDDLRAVLATMPQIPPVERARSRGPADAVHIDIDVQVPPEMTADQTSSLTYAIRERLRDELITNIVGAYVFMGGFIGIEQLVGNTTEAVSTFILVAIPMFILMGAAVASSRAGGDLYEALDRWLTRVPGGLVISNLGACALFAAMSGSSPATCASATRPRWPGSSSCAWPTVARSAWPRPSSPARASWTCPRSTTAAPSTPSSPTSTACARAAA